MKKRILAIWGIILIMSSFSACGHLLKVEQNEKSNLFPEPTSLPTSEPTAFPETENGIDVVDVCGMKSETAEAVLKSHGFETKIIEENSETAEVGTVISQLPRPENGYALHEGDTVTLIVSAGAEKNFAYLTEKLYLEEKTDTKDNSFSLFEGRAYGSEACRNAIKYTFSHRPSDYPDEVQQQGYAVYSVSYDISEGYESFSCLLTHTDSESKVDVEILGDDQLLFSQGIEEDSPAIRLDLDVGEVNVLTVRITGNLNYLEDVTNIVLAEAVLKK